MSRTLKSRAFRVLVVEDDAVVLELITTRLELAGFHTARARNGFEGLGAVQTHRPDAMVLDLNMPVMDGFVVLAKLKGLGLLARTPTLVLTGRNKPEDVKTAIAMGARDFLSKPFRDEQLIQRVGRLVRKLPAAPARAGSEECYGDIVAMDPPIDEITSRRS